MTATAEVETFTVLTDAIDRFTRYLKRQEGLSPTTISQYRADCLKLAAWLTEVRPQVKGWEDVQESDFRRYVDQHDPEPARGRRLMSSWRKLWTYLTDIEELDMKRGPLALKGKKLRRSKPNYLTPPEITRLVAAVEGRSPEQIERNRAIITFLYGSGCRITEALTLKMNDVQFDMAGIPQKIRVLGKGNKERNLYLSPTAQRALTHWLKYKQLEGENGPYVFSYLTGTRRGQRLHPLTIERVMKKAGEKAKLPPERCTPHKLRHAHATALMDAGLSLQEVQEVLGHESIATTRIYAHIDPDRFASAMTRLPEI